MPKIIATTIRVGNVLQYQNSLWVVVKTAHVKPGKGGAFATIEMKNLIEGRTLNERVRSADTVGRGTVVQR